ncbi:MAG TPA: hypothetical protein VMG31_10340 [Verrucomicrobiae bacterium]|nr:hypothetical protein [Verrucomicrobiae bacterium]
MNCVELQRSLAEIEDGSSAEQRAHLRICPECSALMADLNLISSSARQLQAVEEPSPRVWNSLEIALRQEGLIRRPRLLAPSVGTRWVWVRWMAPAAAALLIAVGLYLRQPSSPPGAPDMNQAVVAQPVSEVALAGLNDDDLLQEISDQGPDVKAEYEDNLRRVNESIQDAKDFVAANPNDEDARLSLLEAYQQKAMLFELAMDRSLP